MVVGSQGKEYQPQVPPIRVEKQPGIVGRLVKSSEGHNDLAVMIPRWPLEGRQNQILRRIQLLIHIPTVISISQGLLGNIGINDLIKTSKIQRSQPA